MNPFEFMKESNESADTLHNLAEIDDVIKRYQQDKKFDRQKAEEIIVKHTLSDPVIGACNNSNSRSFIPFSQATDEMVYQHLCLIRQYLLKKRELELSEKLLKRENGYTTP